MQVDAITRKSSLLAILLFVVIMVAALVRATHTPYGIEVAEWAFRCRTISVVISAAVLGLTTILVGRLFMRTGLSKSFCTLPIPLFGLLAWGIATPPHLLSSSVATLLFVLALLLLCRSINVADERNSVFVAAVLLGAMPLLHPVYIALVVVLPLVILLFTLNARQIFIMAMGYLLPLFLASYVVWYSGGEFEAVVCNIAERLATPIDYSSAEVPYGAIVLVVYGVAIMIWGVVYTIVRPNKMFLVARVRRTLYLFLLLALAIGTSAFIPCCGTVMLPVMAVVGAVLSSFVLSLLPTTHSTIAYWLFLALFVTHLFFE